MSGAAYFQSRLVGFAVEGHTATLRLNRPDKLNALNEEMLDAIESACDQVDASSEIRVLILSAEGERAFCAGADIKAWSSLPPVEMWRSWTRRGQRLFRRIEGLRVPTVALVDGIAYGGGCELALACDLIGCTERARFAFPETGIAAVPGWSGTRRLPSRIGLARSKYMMFTGEPISAETARSWGLVIEVSESRDALEAWGRGIAGTISGKAPIALQATKALLNAGSLSGEGHDAAEALAGGFTALTSDGAEGIASFTEKRPPEYTDS